MPKNNKWGWDLQEYSSFKGVACMKAIGCHIIAELSHCNSETRTDLDMVKSIMMRAALEAKAEIKETAFHRFSPKV